MIIKGKYNDAAVYASDIEKEAIEQIRGICDLQAYSGSHIAIMPDVHAGKGCTIGTTMTLHGKVSPNLVGVDIGCGMYVAELLEQDIDFAKLDALIRAKIPCGMNVRDTPHAFLSRIDLSELRCVKHVKIPYINVSLGTLGGGNHFIELDKDDEGRIFLVIHSGSRFLGTTIASLYQQASIASLKGNTKEDQKKLIETLKAEGKAKSIQSELAKLKAASCPVDEDLAYCEGALFDDYIHDMGIAQRFAWLNREAMAQEIIDGMGWRVSSCFHTVHNYIDIEHMILRKGAVSSRCGERLIIPINMRDGSLICIGKGNPDWNFSAPHGAGRKFSRKAAKKTFGVEEFKAQMEGIYSTSVSEATLDESPMAYKSIDDILGCIGPTAEVIKRIKPIYNFKAGDETPAWKK